MITDKHIDYLQFSIPFEHMPFDSNFKPCKGIPYYAKGYIGEFGERYYMGTGRNTNPLVVMSGTALNNWRSIVDLPSWLGECIGNGAKVSRIDMAFDCYIGDDLITPSDYVQWHFDGKIETSKTWSVAPKTISSWERASGIVVENIETLYFGDWKKRGKRGIVRVYDKGVDLGTYANSIVRLEVEDKRDKAHATAKRYANGDSVGSLIRSRFDVRDKRWQDAIDSPSIDMYRGESDNEGNDDGTWKWLIEQVAPSLGKSIAYDAINGERGNFDSFNDAVARAYNGVINKV